MESETFFKKLCNLAKKYEIVYVSKPEISQHRYNIGNSVDLFVYTDDKYSKDSAVYYRSTKIPLSLEHFELFCEHVKAEHNKQLKYYENTILNDFLKLEI